MTMSRHWLHLLAIFHLLRNNCAYVKLFNTENELAVQSYDCIYYINGTTGNNETTPYCIRTNQTASLSRSFSVNRCENSGKEWKFKALKELNVAQDEVLLWSSSIEMADRYAAYLKTEREQFADDQICNCSLNTFGKFCEYEFMTMSTFEKTIEYQFDLKQKYRNGSQLWSNMTCYTALTNCYFGLRCLAWQNICDGKQQCLDGIDEDHCEELEYNECEENEYRCQDGSCISEQYWLDLEYDCSDRSDEQQTEGVPFHVNYYYEMTSMLCPVISSQFQCDEGTAHHNYLPCGDGQFQLDEASDTSRCYNYRVNMFFCEYKWSDARTLAQWTLENGHCVQYGWIEKNLIDMNDDEKCVFYLKCHLSDGSNVGCEDAMQDFHSLCQNRTINYPSRPFFKPYVQTVYRLSEVTSSSTPDYVFFNGSMRCIGHQARSGPQETHFEWTLFDKNYRSDVLFCNNSEIKHISGPKFAENCWNDTKQSFLCQDSYRCISQHRLRNGIHDCTYEEDEDYSQRCLMKNKHRFHCLETSSLCLFASDMGDGYSRCNGGGDEYIAQLKWNLFDRQCTTSNSIECNLLKMYIQSPSSILTFEIDKVFIFRQYCDTLWQLPRGFDESLCKEWKCPRDQYQCLSGHCILMKFLSYPHHTEWHCPDASDKIGLFRIVQLSKHNARLISHSYLEELKVSHKDHLIVYDIAAFTTLCNYTEEYGCILANVNDSLNFTTNRPCIHLTQIGDEIVDCYGGLDERNLLTCGNNTFEQHGYDFHCDSHECIPYHQQCEKRCSNNADDLLCDRLPTLWDSFCKNLTRSDICIEAPEQQCDLFRSRSYYCDSARLFGKHRALPYRFKALLKRETRIYLPKHPTSEDSLISHHVPLPQHKTINIYTNAMENQENDGEEGWICSRGVAIKRNKTNQVQCFCPPSLYGEYCQYFSDRITVIISLDNIPSQLLEQKTSIIKVLALLLSNNDIIDHRVFHLPLILARELNKKFRFNLVYPRPKVLSNIYTVRFEAFHLSLDSSIEFLAVWEYIVQFPFLPSYRLAQVLKFEKQPTLTMAMHICRTANPCPHTATCYPMMNQINNMSAYYCYCKSNSFGKKCEQSFSVSSSSLVCSKHSLLRPLSSRKSICLCLSHAYGPTCHLDHTCVNRNPCGINRGECYNNPDDIIRDYICICEKKFFGDHCTFDSAVVKIDFTDFSYVQTPSSMILSSIIYLYDLHDDTLDLMMRQKRVYQGLPPPATEIYHNGFYLPILGVIKLYHKQSLSNDYVANLNQPDYFILYIASFNISRMNLTSVINQKNYCPSTLMAFRKNVSDVSYLSELLYSKEADFDKGFNLSEMVFRYHLLCAEPYSLMCFHDDNYLCLCDVDDHAECSRYDSKSDQCGQCRAGGQCIHGDLDDRRDFICLCPRCYHGSICQHNTELFSFTLETLLTDDLHSSSIVVQRLFSSLLIIIPSLLLLIGAGNNVCCFVTFNRKKPLLVGIGHYLRTASIINQLALFLLLFKLIHLVLSIKGVIVHYLVNTILCKALPYLLSCTSRMSYWLMGMIAIERVYVTWCLQGTWLKSPRIAKRIIATIIIGVVAFNIHEVIFYQSIEDPKSSDVSNSTWCVTSYPSVIATYNQVNIILNYIMPFFINLLSTIMLIILITRRRAMVTTKRMDRLQSESNSTSILRGYIDLLVEKKELILAPLVTMVPQLFSVPQFILSFSLACQEFKISWQRYLLIISYFITFLPQVLSYKLYISPSKFYEEEFRATKLGKKIKKWQRSSMSRQTDSISAMTSRINNQTRTKS